MVLDAPFTEDVSHIWSLPEQRHGQRLGTAMRWPQPEGHCCIGRLMLSQPSRPGVGSTAEQLDSLWFCVCVA